MKKMFTTFAVSAFSLTAFAQGYISWQGAAGLLIVQTNSTTYSLTQPSTGFPPLYGTVGVTLGNNIANNVALGYPGYYYELLTSTTATTAPTTLADFSAWADTGLGATNAAASNGKTIQVNGSPLTQADNWPANAVQAVVLVGWSANLGSTWSAVLNKFQNWATDGNGFLIDSPYAAYFGVSSFGSGVQAVAGTGTANQVIGVAIGEIYNPSTNPMNLYELANPVPEPSTIAFAAIGGAFLLLFRRKNYLV